MNPLVFENRDFQDGATAQDSKNSAQTKFDQWYNSLGEKKHVTGFVDSKGAWKFSDRESKLDTHSGTIVEQTVIPPRQFDASSVITKVDEAGNVTYETADGIPVQPLKFTE